MVRKHIHCYERAMLGDKIIFKCNIPDCTHYLFKKMAVNKLTLCNRCNEQMFLTKAAMRRVKPHCETCTKHSKKKDVKFDKLKELVSSLVP